jgi:hypothetical protein
MSKKEILQKILKLTEEFILKWYIQIKMIFVNIIIVNVKFSV